jgi:hypothetical protein
METPGQAQQMAAQIFQDMVMQEAIKDKTIQVEQKLKDQETGKYVDVNEDGDVLAYKDEAKSQDSDDDFGEDEE